MTPQDVDVASKSVDCPVGLRHRYNRPVTKRSRLVRASFKVVELVVLFGFDGVKVEAPNLEHQRCIFKERRTVYVILHLYTASNTKLTY